jgi:hypothetical protein
VSWRIRRFLSGKCLALSGAGSPTARCLVWVGAYRLVSTPSCLPSACSRRHPSPPSFGFLSFVVGSLRRAGQLQELPAVSASTLPRLHTPLWGRGTLEAAMRSFGARKSRDSASLSVETQPVHRGCQARCPVEEWTGSAMQNWTLQHRRWRTLGGMVATCPPRDCGYRRPGKRKPGAHPRPPDLHPIGERALPGAP